MSQYICEFNENKASELVLEEMTIQDSCKRFSEVIYLVRAVRNMKQH